MMNFLSRGFFGKKEKKNEEAFDQMFSQNKPKIEEEESLSKFYPPEPGEQVNEYFETEGSANENNTLDFVDIPEEKESISYWETPKSRNFPNNTQISQEFGKGERPVAYLKPAVSRPSPRLESTAPVFVKVEKYEDIVQSLHEIKALLRDLKGMFPLLLEIDDVKKSAIDLMRVTIQKVEKDITRLDADFKKPGQMTVDMPGEIENTHVSDSLTFLQSQLSALKGELERAKQE
jgi:hypothetical protein